MLALLCGILLLALTASSGAAAPPGWISQAARRATPAGADAAPAILLYRHTFVEIDAYGVSKRTHRLVLRIQNAQGAGWATAMVPYLRSGGRVSTASAWLLRDGREIKNVNQRDWVDASIDVNGALYSDSRYKALTFAGDALAGDVFAAETEVTTPMLFAEEDYTWGLAGLPLLSDTFELKLPSGFTADAQLHGNPAPIRRESPDRRSMSWSLADQPFLPNEPSAPSFDVVRPRLLVRIQPPPKQRGFKAVVINHWRELAAWTQRLNGEQCDHSPQLSDTAQRVSRGTAGDLEKIRALSQHVQRFRYATVIQGLTKGLGFQPNKASRVLALGYGDCKDKANLLCALLREVNIDAFIAAARAYDDAAVQPAFPSAAQFNHAIVAIRVGEEIDLPAVVETEAGRLLFFDPTAEHTLLGDLPFHLQGTLVFLQKEGVDRLVALPRIPPFRGHRFSRRATLQITSDGTCTGSVTISAAGQAGAFLRELAHRSTGPATMERLAREQLNEAVRVGTLKNLTHRDDPDSGEYALSFEITKPNYLQPLRNSMSVLKAEFFSRDGVPALTAPERKLPLKLLAIAFDDEAEFSLPPGMIPDELPGDTAFSSDYGSYKKTVIVSGSTVRIARQVELRAGIVPSVEYESVRKFLSNIGKADRASLVLRSFDDVGVQ